jgi:hypothetical protein
MMVDVPIIKSSLDHDKLRKILLQKIQVYMSASGQKKLAPIGIGGLLFLSL